MWQEVKTFKVYNKQNFKIINNNVDDGENEKQEETIEDLDILALAYYDTDYSNLVLEKIDIDNMRWVERKTLSLDNVKIANGRYSSSGASSAVQFSINGEDIFFLETQHPNPGEPEVYGSTLYHTTFSESDKYEEIISTMVPANPNYSYIASWEYSFEKNRIFLVRYELDEHTIAGIYLQYYDLLLNKLVDLKSYKPDGHISFLRVIDDYIYVMFEPGLIHKIDASNGKIIEEIRVFDYEELKEGGRVDFTNSALSPDGSKYIYGSTEGSHIYTIKDGNLVTKNNGVIKNLNRLWSDNSKYVIEIYENGEEKEAKIVDLSLDVVQKIPNYRYTFMWEPGPYIIYLDEDKKLEFYNIDTNKSVNIHDVSNSPSHYKGINWIRRDIENKEELTSNLDDLRPETKDDWVAWRRDDNKFIGLKGQELYNKKFNNSEDVIILIDRFKDFFKKQGFDINENNNEPTGVQYKLDPSVGFEKDDLKCLLDWSFETTSKIPLRLRCAYYTQEAEEEFGIFYPLLAKTDDVRMWVDKKTDDFAVGAVGAWRGGAKWYASKQNGEWALDEVTQDAICFFEDIVNRYPKELLGEGMSEFCGN